jgi:fucose permease
VNWLHAFFGIGATIGPALMTVLLTRDLSWRIGYGILAGMLGVLTVLFVWTVRLWDLPQDESAAAVPAVASVGESLRRPIVWAHALVFFIYCGIESTASQLLFTLFRESRGESIAVAGGIVSGYWAALTIGRFVFGQIAHHVGPLATVRIGMGLAVIATSLIRWNPVPAVGLAGAVLLGFSLAPIFPTLISLTPVRVGERFAPQAVGFQISAAAVGIGLVPSAVAATAGRVGLEFISLELLVATITLLGLHEVVHRIAGAREKKV